jgi:hypothetical protein
MKKNVLLWGLYFVVCAAVIGAAINAGIRNGRCYECRLAFKDSALANK